MSNPTPIAGPQKGKICLAYPTTGARASTIEQLQLYAVRFSVSDTGCWLWQKRINRTGYGILYSRVIGKIVFAHRFMYELFNGEIDPESHTDHLCRVRNCVNPAHLENVTRYVNWERSMAPMAVHHRKTECPKGHPYSGENIIWRKEGGRRCRICRTESVRVRNHKRWLKVKAAKQLAPPNYKEK